MSEKKAPNIPVRPGSDPTRFHVRNVAGKLEEIAVYEIATGRKLVTTFIDAKEAVATGFYSWQPPAAGDPEAA